jgi:hypothetical protein
LSSSLAIFSNDSSLNLPILFIFFHKNLKSFEK